MGKLNGNYNSVVTHAVSTFYTSGTRRVPGRSWSKIKDSLSSIAFLQSWEGEKKECMLG